MPNLERGKRKSTLSGDIAYLQKIQQKYIDRIKELIIKQDKLKSIEIISMLTTATGLPFPMFSQIPDDYRLPKDAMEPHTIQKMINCKFDTFKKMETPHPHHFDTVGSHFLNLEKEF